jgi:hypothetical protein
MKQQFDGTAERASTARNFTGEYGQVKDIEVTFGKEKNFKRERTMKKLKKTKRGKRGQFCGSSPIGRT